MKHAVLAGSFAIALAPFAANAGGFTEPAAPAPAPIVPAAPIGTDWSGFYGGAQLEFGDITADVAGTDTEAASGDGALYGIFGGYRFDFGNVVVGGEIDYNLADIDLEDPAGAGVGTLDSVLRAGAEVGFDAGPALIYGTAGLTQATATIAGTEDTGDGYFFGAGVDYLLTDQITIGAEVLQHEFEDFSTAAGDLDVSATTFGINAAFRF